MTNVRERNGYTYHIEADLSAFGRRNAFSVTSEAANEYVQPLIDEVYNEFRRLQTEPVSAEGKRIKVTVPALDAALVKVK